MPWFLQKPRTTRRQNCVFVFGASVSRKRDFHLTRFSANGGLLKRSRKQAKQKETLSSFVHLPDHGRSPGEERRRPAPQRQAHPDLNGWWGSGSTWHSLFLTYGIYHTA